MQAQITELQNKTSTELNLAQIDLNKTDIALIKQTLGITDTSKVGDLSIIGQIAAKKIVVEEVETGGITITTTVDKDSATIGSGEIAKFVDKIGKKDEDGNDVPDGIDDNDNSVFIKTTAATEKSKVFVTPNSATDNPLAVATIKKGDNGFTVKVANPIKNDLEFDWWIVETK